ncbi:MAG: transketolase family protein [Nitrososphaerales archaeon]
MSASTISESKGRPVLGSIRDAFGDALVRLGGNSEKIIVLDGDVNDSTKTSKFGSKFPKRFYNLGISEQDIVSTSVGFALNGFIPYVSAFASFLSRAMDQLRYTVAYHNLPIKVVCTHSGLGVGEDGASAQAINDLAMIRSIPNFEVFAPSDITSTKICTLRISERKGPSYERLTRHDALTVYENEDAFKFGVANKLAEGSDVTIASSGATLEFSLQATKELAKQGIKATLLDFHMIKPIDSKSLERAAKNTGAIVTVEDHNIIGGFGGAVAECLSEKYPTIQARIGIQDCFAESGPYQELYAKYGISTKTIVAKAIELVQKK